MKTEAQPKTTFLKDYRQPDFWVPETHLDFDLHEDRALVRSRLKFERNVAQVGSAAAPLVLNGESLKLLSVKLNGQLLAADRFELTSTHLTIHVVPDQFEIEIEAENNPAANLACEGLYRSSSMFCTQCEAESFRRITYFIDRPDVMSVYTVRIEADRAKYPILLSNGNKVSSRDLGNGRHEAVWKDPFKKPCYLFALVAGDLGVLEDSFKTKSGREVKLQIFARHGLQDRCRHAMDSLKWSMKWDEEVYGLEYDLDIFMIVVADDFNMGAMENKGLNIFNANYVLADEKTATDHDFNAVTAVVGHEYFHNWTGNRVTCRDWFQLSLKEGLTVFRDQRFSSDIGSAAVKRIDDVIHLRTHQFAEDSGPMAHPIRPNSFITIDNFYTLTIYEKGAEVIRMIETLLGREGFRKGMDLYFKRHDGQAVTTEDFVAAMADANGPEYKPIMQGQFQNWYDQAGTPVVKVESEHDPKTQTFKVVLSQSCPATPGQSEKKPFMIPVAVGLIGRDGRDLPLQLARGSGAHERVSSGSLRIHDSGAQTLVLHLREPKQEFVFTGVNERPVLSILRGFSAPVRTDFQVSIEDLAFQIAHDADEFCRWEAAQQLAVQVTKELVDDFKEGRPLRNPRAFVEAFTKIIGNPWKDPAFASYILTLPSEQYLAQFFKEVDIDAIHAAREHLRSAMGARFQNEFRAIYARTETDATNGLNATAIGTRMLKNLTLTYLLTGETRESLDRAMNQLRSATNMTEELGALQALTHVNAKDRETAMNEFYQKWKNEPLVVNKWLMVQATSKREDTIERVKMLGADPLFDKNNPNKIYSLYSAFGRFNPVRFNDKSGAGYRLIADQVMEIDGRNPQVAARLMGAFGHWRTLDPRRQDLIKAEITRILAKPGLSSNVYEIASKIL